MVTIPFLISNSLIAETGGLVKINFSIWSSIKKISKIPFLPLYPVKLQALHPFSETVGIFKESKSGNSISFGKLCKLFLISANSFVVGLILTQHSWHTFLTNLSLTTILMAGAIDDGF